MILSYLLFISLYIHASFAATTDGYKSYKDYKIYEIEGDKYRMSKIIEYLLEKYELPHHQMSGGKCSIMVAPHLVPVVDSVVKSGGLTSKLVVDDYSEIIKLERAQPRDNEGFSWTAYHDVDVIYAYLQNMSQEHPKLTKLVDAGGSYEGRRILGLRINSCTSYIKPVMFIESGIHAREWITPTVTTYFINELLTSRDPNIQQLRNTFDWHIFPTVNPDGYHYTFTTDRMWRKTRSRTSHWLCRGADANRNFDYNWMQHRSSSWPCDYIRYAGSKPFSEIETRSLAHYISGLDNLRGYVSFHAFGRMLLVPYSDSTHHFDNYDDLVKIGQSSLDYGYEVNHEKFNGPATAAEILYKSSGVSMDWVRSTLNTSLVFTYELRGYNFYWPPSRISEQGDEVTQMMLGLAVGAAKLGYI